MTAEETFSKIDKDISKSNLLKANKMIDKNKQMRTQ